jgi:hypothetical protein
MDEAAEGFESLAVKHPDRLPFRAVTIAVGIVFHPGQE